MQKRDEQKISKLKIKFTVPVFYILRLKFRFDGKENSVTELPKHLQNKQS